MTITTVRPNSIPYLDPTWVWNTSPSASVLADDSDLTEVETTYADTGDGITLGFGTFTLAPSTLRSVGIRVRAVASSAGGRLTGQLRFAGRNYWTTVQVSSDGFDTYTVGQVLVPQSMTPAAVQAAINDVLVDFNQESPSVSIALSEVYLDLEHFQYPTVSVTPPASPVTDTTSPVVTLGWSQPDGVRADRWTVRTFTQAVYSQTGFNPATAKAIAETTLFGSIDSATVGPLVDGITYRTYARAAFLRGFLWWSNWAQGQFNIAIGDSPIIDSVTATPEDGSARIRLVIERDTGSMDWDIIDVERSDDAGSTWLPVFGSTGVDPPGDVWIGYDYTAGNGVPVLYRARAHADLAGQLISGGYTLTGSAVAWSSPDTWLKHPSRPSLSRVVLPSFQPQPSRARPSAEFDVVGRAAPVVVSDVLKSPRSELVFVTQTAQEADDLFVLLGETYLQIHPPATYRVPFDWIAIGDVEEIRPAVGDIADPLRLWRVPIIAIDRPTDSPVELFGGTTWQDLLDSGQTWQDVFDSGTTWGAYL